MPVHLLNVTFEYIQRKQCTMQASKIVVNRKIKMVTNNYDVNNY